MAYVFEGARSFGWVTFDDPVYVTDNPNVRAGLTLDGLRWAFASGHGSNWHPLTWLSHMLDVELHGLDAGGHHVTSVLLHGLNAILLFVLLARATGTVWRAGLVAAWFAVHPLHVESVAWVSERKDVLSAAFGLLAGLAWLRYTRLAGEGKRGLVAYGATLLLFGAGLLSKPMLVTFPFVLLLADVWPLWRLAGSDRPGLTLSRALVEKLPFFALSVASSVVTALVQHAGRAMEPGTEIALGARTVNALVAYARYLVMTFWPSELAVLYPHPALPGGTPLAMWQILGAAALLAAITLATWRARRLGWPVIGWLGYLGTLVPVIGIVQVGSQAIADRYTYLPLVGVFLLLAWGLERLVVLAPRARLPVAAVAGLSLGLACAQARLQTLVWQSPETLYARALEVAPDMPVLLVNVGIHQRRAGRTEQAIEWYQRALAVDPDSELALYNLAVAHHLRQELERAEALYRRVIELWPEHVKALANLSAVVRELGRPAEADALFQRAKALRPELGSAN